MHNLLSSINKTLKELVLFHHTCTPLSLKICSLKICCVTTESHVPIVSMFLHHFPRNPIEAGKGHCLPTERHSAAEGNLWSLELQKFSNLFINLD